MKISGLHLFIILFGSLLLTYSLGTFMREGFTNIDLPPPITATGSGPYSNAAIPTYPSGAGPSGAGPSGAATGASAVASGAGPYPSGAASAAASAATTGAASAAGPYPIGAASGIAKLENLGSDVMGTYDYLKQKFNNVKNKLEGPITDNNTNVYNYSQQRYDSYQGQAGDTVIVSPPPPQTMGLPSSSSPSPYPFPAPPPPPFNQNKNALGIPYSQIPQGQMDLYILKSEVIPPVCPACPNVTACASKEPPLPCPPCARCPEPAFECKKVPNYRGGDNNYLPLPVLADFSQFGM